MTLEVELWFLESEWLFLVDVEVNLLTVVWEGLLEWLVVGDRGVEHGNLEELNEWKIFQEVGKVQLEVILLVLSLKVMVWN